MARSPIARSVFTVGLAGALLVLPFSAGALALSTVDELLAPVTEVLPEPVAEAVDTVTAPVKAVVDTQVAPVVNQVVHQVLGITPAPVRDLAGRAVPSKPSAGPVVASPPTTSAGASAPAPADSPRDRLFRAGSALRSVPVSSNSFPLRDLFIDPSPISAGAAQAGMNPASGGAPGWLVATAAGLLVLVAAAHIAYADQRLSSGAAAVKV